MIHDRVGGDERKLVIVLLASSCNVRVFRGDQLSWCR
jgi:hypothetical protein